jgi:phosphoglycerate dehydrogenase-like enzyme
MAGTPHIVLLTAPEAGVLPGLEPVLTEVKLSHVCDQASLKAELPEADILLVTDFRTEMLRGAWPQHHHISWLHAASAGVNTLLFPELVDSDVQVTNARGVFDRGIAEYVLGAVLLFAKDSMNNLRYQQQHEWRHRETELIRGRTALIVGAGSIGREVARLLQAAGMQVIGTARHARQDANFTAVYAGDRLPDLLPDADFVVITAPLTGETRGLFDAAAFARMQPGARLINVARGPIVVERDLINALQEGVIAGAVLDVFEQEPLAAQSPLWDMPQVMITAHMAGDFRGWEQALGEQFVENYYRWKHSQPLHNVVDKHKGYISSCAETVPKH